MSSYPPLLNNLAVSLNAEVPPFKHFTGGLAHYNKDNPLQLASFKPFFSKFKSNDQQ